MALINNCLTCGKETTNPKFCSRSCSAKTCNKAFPKRRVEGKCATCGTSVTRRHKYCITCRPGKPLDLSSITYSEISGKRLYQKNSRIRNIARNLYIKSGKPKLCTRCGYDKHYEVCHIKAVSSFTQQCKMSNINDLNNLIALCPNCHWELDKDLWSVEELT